ncbi:hypothetical protein I6G82_04690 [Lysinibacillus macroides]|uniref:Uncharacterized protein n=1 Tax=Lysinibacillus macroides TaxID=33935 RepID=A0A0M9DHV5_9BACI|nr:hypothetical protein [Lysinibacillus macroides]KOY80923.1 hypothetical protein ADM90_17295 [Lysinibacillus macroides]QPR68934.1 hypothetical protein I6G82_04690 [Lysinibacillus macroides]
MHRRRRIIIGLFLALMVVVILFIKLSEDKTSKVNREEQSLLPQEELSQAALQEKLLETYVGIDVKRTEKKELVIQVVGDAEYFLSIKNDLESIAKQAIKDTVLEDYTIVFERWELTSLLDPNKKMDDDTNFLIEALIEGLQAFDVYEYLTLKNRTTIIIQTTIKDVNQEARRLITKMEDTVNKIIQTNTSHNDLYTIYIVDAQQKKIN